MSIDIEPLGEACLEDAFDLATRVFVAHSSLHLALGITVRAYRAYLEDSFRAMVHEGLSVVAIDRVRQQVVGVMIATDLRNQVTDQVEQSGEMAPLAALTAHLCRSYMAGRSVATNQTILVDMAAVLPASRHGGIYQKMRLAVQARARRRGYTRVVGELSSAATQHVVLTKMGHKKCAEIVFHDFCFNNAYPFRVINDPVSLILAEGHL